MNRPRGEKSLLEHISTHWTTVEDPTQFVLRYAPAIREYIANLLKGQQDTDDVAQDFLATVMTRGFSEKQVTRGRFRDFLRVAIRNAVIDHLRAKRLPVADPQLLQDTVAEQEDIPWINYWRSCVLDAAWLRLRRFQKETAGNMYYTVLKLTIDFPDDSSQQVAERVSKAVGRAVKTDAYRQQLHRARHKFAELIVEEVRDTLRQKDSEELTEELRELGLDRYVANYLD